jgi:response regulator RpfG family c-di-GMP phosphodiesterase
MLERELVTSPGRRAGRPVPGRLGGLQEELASTEFELNHALRVALRTREPIRQLVAHATRVLVLVDWLSSELDVGEAEFEHLQFAAQLHEIGMITVPLRILEHPGPLTPGELARVRDQAALGAEIVRGYHSPRTAHIIECQYIPHAELSARFPDGSTDLLLAGILRVADVFDTMGYPRPYQRAWSVEERVLELQSGMGDRYHPLVVDTFLRSWLSHGQPGPRVL